VSQITNSVKKLLEGKLGRLETSKTAAAQSLAKTVKHALNIHDALGSVREPIKQRAETEQRNAAWMLTETQKAFGGRLRELARLEIDLTTWKAAHRASKPALPPVDRSDIFGALETVALCQRIATMKVTDYHTLSSTERMAALRMPTLAKVPASVEARWTDEAVAAANPERMTSFTEDLAVIDEAEQALTIVKLSLQSEAGYVDNSTGLPSGAWGTFEREHLAPIRKELEAAEAAKAKIRADDAVAEARKALVAAENEQHRQEIEALRKL
jgi:hypothetical protein